MPKLAQDCIRSWKQFCPDYEIKLWNEANSKRYFNTFCKQAYREKSYAFVSDCVRVQALNEFGGIYLDTDMMLVKPLNDLHQYAFFAAHEVPGRVNFSFFGGLPGNHFLGTMQDYYDQNSFNRYSLPVITHLFKEVVNDGNLREKEMLFTPEFCYPMPYEKRDQDYQSFITPKTYGVHLWDHSWRPARKQTLGWLINNLMKVHVDYYFYNYPKAYFRRYRKEFARKIYHILIGKSSV